MPKLTDPTLSTHQIDGTGYSFSATRIENLGATEYTLVALCVDSSGSISGSERAIEKAIQEIVKSCQYSPRADNLMLRFVVFASFLTEVHGFKPLSQCNVADYDKTVHPGGMTALYDASLNAVESVSRYGKDLTDQDFGVNGIVFVITDGEENASKMTIGEVQKAVAGAVRSEAIESLRTVLVGVSTGGSLNTYLQNYKDGVGFDQYVSIPDASAKNLAKLADFVSKSISSQSQALGTGSVSQSLTF